MWQTNKRTAFEKSALNGFLTECQRTGRRNSLRATVNCSCDWYRFLLEAHFAGQRVGKVLDA
jgi:hypothetical protein